MYSRTHTPSQEYACLVALCHCSAKCRFTVSPIWRTPLITWRTTDGTCAAWMRSGNITICTPWSHNSAAKFALIVYGVGCLDADRGLIQIVNAQMNLYSLTERSCPKDTLQVIAASTKLSHAPSKPHVVMAMLASADIKI